MSPTEFMILDINPEPWATGNTFVARKNGKIHSGIAPNPKVVDYKEALAEAVRELHPTYNSDTQYWDVQFIFWRQIERWQVKGKWKTGNYADSTNLQKATEDALQGLLFGNDRRNRFISSLIEAQGLDVEPAIYIRVKEYSHWDHVDRVDRAVRMMKETRINTEKQRQLNNEWGPQK